MFARYGFLAGINFLLGIIAFAAIIVAMFFLYSKVVPVKHDGNLSNPRLQKLHDYFNFKKLYIETILKFCFVLATVVCEVMGAYVIISTFLTFIFTIASFQIGMLFGGIFGGLLIMTLGALVIRLIYEGTMMFIILVKNVIEINKKS